MEKSEINLMKEIDGFEKRATAKVECVHEEIVPQISEAKFFIKLTESSNYVGMKRIIECVDQGRHLLIHMGAVQCDLDMQCLLDVVPKVNFERSQYVDINSDEVNVGRLFLRFHCRNKRKSRRAENIYSTIQPSVTHFESRLTPISVKSENTQQKQYSERRSNTLSHSSAAYMLLKFSRAFKVDKKSMKTL
ncbi:hypothetical protein GJ496_007232 [Pomphorhynchus laevis]|nr:hypothetical protein GJ496_007232 [Pomphorhynchus laevis]